MNDKAPPAFDALDGSRLTVAIVVSRFNQVISEGLLRGARRALARHGVATAAVREFWVPGAFELALAAKRVAASPANGVDAIVCLGAVIRGDTPHFEYVASAAAHGIQHVALETGIPVVFGVLTTDTVEQAEERIRDDETNKGYEAALAAVATAQVLLEIDS